MQYLENANHSVGSQHVVCVCVCVCVLPVLTAESDTILNKKKTSLEEQQLYRTKKEKIYAWESLRTSLIIAEGPA